MDSSTVGCVDSSSVDYVGWSTADCVGLSFVDYVGWSSVGCVGFVESSTVDCAD